MKKLFLIQLLSLFFILTAQGNTATAEGLNYLKLKDKFESSPQGIRSGLYDYFPGRCFDSAYPFTPIASVLVTWEDPSYGPLEVFAQILGDRYQSPDYFDARYSRNFSQSLINSVKHITSTSLYIDGFGESVFRDDKGGSYKLRRENRFLFVKMETGMGTFHCYFWSLNKFPTR